MLGKVMMIFSRLKIQLLRLSQPTNCRKWTRIKTGSPKKKLSRILLVLCTQLASTWYTYFSLFTNIL
jgi:hypothetical protein